jgi:hypothetical protein
MLFRFKPLAAFTAASALALGFFGCEDDKVVECVGGVLVDGQCEGKCDPDTCLEGNVCVGNRCVLACASHDECYRAWRGDPGNQACVARKVDTAGGLEDGTETFVCAASDKHPSISAPCPFTTECDTAFACPDGTPCGASLAEGEASCPAEECRALTCVTTGEGDAEAYCTTLDCSTDADCGPGHFCAIVNVPNKICGTNKGETDPCIEPSAFTQNGQTYQEGPQGLLRNACRKATGCAPCTTNVDCGGGDLSCVTIGDSQHCSKSCAEDADCPNDYACFSNFCIPRTGSCQPPATDNFCHPCLDDLDCGPAGGSVACIEASGGQRACFDLSFPATCMTDDDCPTSPSGRHGECLDEGEGLSPGDGVYRRCYLPFFPGSSRFQCWPD